MSTTSHPSRPEFGSRPAGLAEPSSAYSRWEPFATTESLRGSFDRLFEEFASSNAVGRDTRLLSPPLDVYESDDTLTLVFEVPGTSKEDLKIQIQDGVLSISGERNVEVREDLGVCQRRERAYGAFFRALALPASVNADGVVAEYVDGAVTIRLPKSETSRPKSVKVR